MLKSVRVWEEVRIVKIKMRRGQGGREKKHRKRGVIELCGSGKHQHWKNRKNRLG